MENRGMKKNAKIVFMGTPDFGAEILKGLAENYTRPVLVITKPDKPAGRKQKPQPSPVKVASSNLKIPILETEDNAVILSKLKELKPDLLISAACGQILPKEILETPKCKSLNVHPSLLPKYRGCSPIRSAILRGDKKTGVTVFLMSEKIDEGKIIAQREIEIGEDNYQELKEKLASLGADLLAETIPLWIEGKIEAEEQKESESSYTDRIKKWEGRIDWTKKAEEIERKVRAFYPWPGTFTFFKEKRLKITSAEAKDLKKDLPPGKVFEKNGLLVVRCGERSLIVNKVQPEGKKEMASEEFLKGNPEIISSVLK